MNTFFADIRLMVRKIFEGAPEQFPLHVPNILMHKKRLVSLAGSTPFFIIDTSIVRFQMGRLNKALHESWGTNIAVAYSFKTNYSVVKNKIITPNNSRAEVVSKRELVMAIKLGFKSDHIIFNGPLKRDEDLILAIKHNVLIHVDNMNELDRLIKIAAIFKKTPRIGLRIHSEVVGMKESRFGFSVERQDAIRAVKYIRDNSRMRLVSIHVHVGTDIDSINVYKDVAITMASFVNDAERVLGYSMHMIDFGGGFPSGARKPFSRETWEFQDTSSYIQVISRGLKGALKQSRYKQLIVEPGRYLVDDAVIFVTRVHGQKIEGRVQKIITDGAITMLPLAYYRPQIVCAFTSMMQPKGDGNLNTIIYGGTCKEDDVLFEGRLPPIEVGNVIIYYCVGAYNQNMGSEFIFSVPTVHFI